MSFSLATAACDWDHGVVWASDASSSANTRALAGRSAGRTTSGLATTTTGCLVADEATGLTSKAMVFAGGDAVTGAATVILAAGAGKRAAHAIDAALRTA